VSLVRGLCVNVKLRLHAASSSATFAFGDLKINGQAIELLRAGGWINDELVEFAFKYLDRQLLLINNLFVGTFKLPSFRMLQISNSFAHALQHC
jgi:hypothetical protein